MCGPKLTDTGYRGQVYNERVFTLSVNCAKEAAKLGVKMFVEVSTAQVYEEGKVGPPAPLTAVPRRRAALTLTWAHGANVAMGARRVGLAETEHGDGQAQAVDDGRALQAARRGGDPKDPQVRRFLSARPALLFPPCVPAVLTPCCSRTRRHSLKYVTVRPAVVYGPHDISGISTWPACAWLRGYERLQRPCALFPTQLRAW